MYVAESAAGAEGPPGPQGPEGPPGPPGEGACISTDPGNALQTGTDGCLALITDPAGPVRPGDNGLTLCLSDDPSNAAQLDDDGCLLVPAVEPGALPRVTLTTQVVTFNESGTFNPADYPGLQSVRVRAVAGGGGAAGIPAVSEGNVFVGQAGAGGTYAESVINAADLPGPIPVTVGAGGAGVAVSPTQTMRAGRGEDSSFGTLVVANNGNPLLGATSNPSTGGGIGSQMYRPGASGNVGSSVGQILIPGENGGAAFAFGQDPLNPGNILIACLPGGASALSRPTAGGSASWTSAGGAMTPGAPQNGLAPGGGAPAPHSGLPAANDAVAGGDGASGVVIVEVTMLTVTAA
ncbi:hypothetical protein HTV80_00080 [Streptomyces sp. Vc74B-19]|uniref:glycine-rich domain-containing protein n=1 Tax=Streptomyces sp. Vc74B-19 TaxID=2741324 RepID=UPI001BFC362F|nr:hypothetical protein [Streptomyces sp. Vc74B-19]MBT3161511.1 hypothetical protein [Streptomyces sp. Vc74B-19]